MRWGYPRKQAIETYNAQDEIDYEIHPEIAADDEVNCGE